MSFYGIPILITIFVTSLIAFYLLYKARELNLGIFISISIGAVILGFAFSPAFNAIMKLLSGFININQKVVLVITLLAVLVAFLLFILIVSLAISVCIPEKLVSIDCCGAIDSFVSKLNIKDDITRLNGKFVTVLQNTAKNVYNLKNKLKKPVDTNKIIDTMGIEKSESENKEFVSDEVAAALEPEQAIPAEDTGFANLIAYIEPAAIELPEYQKNNSEIEENVIDNQDIQEDIIYDDLSEISTDPVINNDELSEVVHTIDMNSAIQLAETETAEEETAKEEVTESETEAEIEIYTETKTEIEVETEPVAAAEAEHGVETMVMDEELAEDTSMSDESFDANALVIKAFDSKEQGRKEEAIAYYMKALKCDISIEMIFWIILDICTLYKNLGLSDLARSILEGMVDEYGNIIQPEIEMEIMNNLK